MARQSALNRNPLERAVLERDRSEHELHDLRLEIDRLRLRNQRLRMEMERYSSFRSALPHHAKGFLRQLITQILPRKRKLFENRYASDKAEFPFRPYQVKIRHPILAHRPRVLHVIGNFYTGGSARLVVDLIEHLGHKYEQEVLTRDVPDTPEYLGVKLLHERHLHTASPVANHLRRFRPDIVHVHYLGLHRNGSRELDWKWYNKVFEAVEKYGCPVVENINILTEPFVSHAVRCYVYVSNYVCCKFGRLDTRNVTIYPGSDLSFFARQDTSSTPDNDIGMVYRLEGDKLNDQSIDALVKVVQRRPGTKAIVVGGGRFLNVYQKATHDAGVADAFTFTGYVGYEDLPALYGRMSIFVAPVHTESFGQACPFAMGMTIPVAGYRVGALEEIVGNPEVLAPAGDSDALADIIVKLLDDPTRRLRIGVQNRQRAQEMFSLETMVNRYTALYDELTAPYHLANREVTS